MLDREVPSVGGLGGVFGGPVGHEPGDRLVDQPLQRGDPDAVCERRDLGVHERCRFAGQRRRWPPRSGGRARPPGHRAALEPIPVAAGTSAPPTSATKLRPASVERPMASANSAMQNSATSGAPSPAIGRPVSPAGGDPGRRFARWTPVGAARPRSPLRSAGPRLRSGGCGPCRSRANTQHVSRGVERSGSDRWGRCHGSIQAATTDRNCRDSPAVEGDSRFLSIRLGGPGWHVGVRPLVSSVRSLRSLLDHRWLRPPRSAYGPWSRLSARFARCSTTGCGRPRRTWSRLPLASLAARPPVVAARSGVRMWVETLAATPQRRGCSGGLG